MVLPTEEKEVVVRTLEDRLANKFDMLQLAREQRNDIIFDEIARSIEVLLKAVPDAYKLLMEEKKNLDKDLEDKSQDIQKRAENAQNKITADAIISNEGFILEWDYREVYEELVIELLQQFKLIPIRSPIYGGIQPADIQEIMSQEPKELPPELPVVEEEPPPPPTQPPQNKPKLSIQKQETFEV